MTILIRKIRQHLRYNLPEPRPDHIRAGTGSVRAGDKVSPPEQRKRAGKYLCYSQRVDVKVWEGFHGTGRINKIEKAGPITASIMTIDCLQAYLIGII